MQAYRTDDIVLVKKYPNGIYRVLSFEGDSYTLIQCGINRLVKITASEAEITIVRKSKKHSRPALKEKEPTILPNLEF